MDDFDKALLVIASVRAALKNQCRHFDKDGRELKTGKEIIDALTNGRFVRIDETDRKENTTTEKELVGVRIQYRRR